MSKREFTITIERYSDSHDGWLSCLHLGEGLSEAEGVRYGDLPVFGQGDTIMESIQDLTTRWTECMVDQAIAALTAKGGPQ